MLNKNKTSRQQNTDYYNIKYKYYSKLRNQVEDLVGRNQKELKNYQKEYDLYIKKSKLQVSSNDKVLDSIQKSPVNLFGDFHAQHQSARFILRMLRQFKESSLILMLECFNEEYDGYLKAYMQGDLSEKDFLKKIEWKKNWGYPWEFTKPLVKWCQNHNVEILGLSSLKVKKLKLRDRFMAQKIKSVLKSYKSTKIFVQVGDYHLSQNHLPSQLKNIKKVNVILQSPEELFFKVLKKNIDLTNLNFVKLGNSEWAAMSVLPWVKWQDYLLLLESGHDKVISNSEIEMTDHVSESIKVVSQILKINVSLSELQVYTSSDDQLLDVIENLPSDLRKHYEKLYLSQQSFYIPEKQIGFVSRMSINQIARVAAFYVLYKVGYYNQTILDSKKYFLNLICLEMLVYFLIKLINPKKKTDTFEDIRKALRMENYNDLGKEPLVIALEQKMSELRYMSFQEIPKDRPVAIKNMTSSSYVAASQILGGILGEKVYLVYHKKIVKIENLQSLLLRKSFDKNFKQYYYDMIETIESWPITIKSKYDQI